MKPTLVDSQFDEPNGVLKNKLNLVDPAELTRLAADFASARLAQLIAKPLRGKFDIPHLRAIHRYIFQDIFPWAGDFREVTTSRTHSFGFPPPQFLVPSLEAIFATLKAEDHLKRLDADAFALLAGHYLGEINAVHPSAKATAAPSASSSARLRCTPAIASRGPASRRTRTTPPRA